MALINAKNYAQPSDPSLSSDSSGPLGHGASRQGGRLGRFVPSGSKLVSVIPVCIIFTVSLAVRVTLFWQDKVIAADGISYVSIARSIFKGDGFTAASHFPPLYPVLIGLFSYLTPYDEVAGKVVSTIMGSLLVIPVYLLGKEIFSKKAGLIASVLVALSPTLVVISGIVLSQSTYITIFMTALYFSWKSFHVDSYKNAIAAGVLFGAAYLTRPEAVIVLIGISAVFLVLQSKSSPGGNALKVVVISWAAFLTIAAPYVYLLHKVFGTWQLTGKSSVTLADSLGWYLNRPDLKREPGFAGLTYLDIIRNYPDFLWKNPLRNLPMTWAELQPSFWLLALLGFLANVTTGEKLRKAAFLTAALLPIGVIVVFFWIDAHYFSPSLPMVFLLGAEGLITLEKGIRSLCDRSGLQKYGEAVPWGLLLGTMLAAKAILPSLVADRSVPYEYSQDGARYDHKLIGLMLHKYLPAGSRVMAKSGRICFYGDFQQVDIPQASISEILQDARNNKARYLIADGTLYFSRPQLEPLLAPLLIPQAKILTTGPFEGLPVFPGGLLLKMLYKDPASVGVAVYEIPE